MWWGERGQGGKEGKEGQRARRDRGQGWTEARRDRGQGGTEGKEGQRGRRDRWVGGIEYEVGQREGWKKKKPVWKKTAEERKMNGKWNKPEGKKRSRTDGRRLFYHMAMSCQQA
ncbi:hypothetical protein Pcinc_038610 [Petrolisthes cinctipes]|uniref:Uncharacterized protein n=1 Tax=Petrolisthes cinctipes TaxID=88211 RepID=A0AAE1BQ56_PETCI|nr:hypothetical protein Pcinc_038610 [Petrolisthes cinctipes]